MQILISSFEMKVENAKILKGQSEDSYSLQAINRPLLIVLNIEPKKVSIF